MKYRLIIFDFDGTLADSYPWFLSIFAELANRYNLPRLEPHELEELRSLDIRRIQRQYHIPFWKFFLIGNHLKRLMKREIHRVNLVAGMQTVLDTLAEQQVRLAVVTSNAEHNVREVLGPRNMARVEYIESGVSMFGKKKKFLKILKQAGVAPDQALSIGDEIRDLHSARAAHIPFAAVTWGYTDQQTMQAHAPELLFSHPDQILPALS